MSDGAVTLNKDGVELTCNEDTAAEMRKIGWADGPVDAKQDKK